MSIRSAPVWIVTLRCTAKAQPGAVSTIMAPRHLPNPPSRLLLAVGRSAQDRPGPRSTLPETGVHQNESSAEGRPEAPRTDFPQYGVACGDPRLQMNARTALFSSSGFLFAPFASRRGGSSTLRDALLSAPSPIATLPPTRNSGLGTPHSSAFSPSGEAPKSAQERGPVYQKPRFSNHEVAPKCAQERLFSIRRIYICRIGGHPRQTTHNEH